MPAAATRIENRLLNGIIPYSLLRRLRFEPLILIGPGSRARDPCKPSDRDSQPAPPPFEPDRQKRSAHTAPAAKRIPKPPCPRPAGTAECDRAPRPEPPGNNARFPRPSAHSYPPPLA